VSTLAGSEKPALIFIIPKPWSKVNQRSAANSGKITGNEALKNQQAPPIIQVYAEGSPDGPAETSGSHGR